MRRSVATWLSLVRVLAQLSMVVITLDSLRRKFLLRLALVIRHSSGAAFSAGFGSKLGLPYRMAQQVGGEIANGAAAAAGTFVPGVLTDPQTNATGDPKGTYVPTTALNGSNRILARFLPYNVLNANGNGGLYGIAAA
jgi:hypothetical protein